MREKEREMEGGREGRGREGGRERGMKGVCACVRVWREGEKEGEGGRERGVRGVCIYVCTCVHVCGV